MYKVLFVSKKFESFVSSWGAVASPKPHENGYIMPLGWERELNTRNIDFVEMEIKETNEDIKSK